MVNNGINLLGLDRGAMEGFFAGLGEKSYRAGQVLKWLHQWGAENFAAMTNLAKPLRAKLQGVASIESPVVVREQRSADGTRKWLLRLTGGHSIETVFIPEIDRGTLCVSSQVGCALDCSFCATGKQGFDRNLSPAEIIGQVWVAARALGQVPKGPRTITNVVLMGMGEPLLNFGNVVTAMQLLMDDFAYGLSRRRITLSTAGLVPVIDRLKDACPVSLAVSLHAPNDALRDELVPINKRYPIDDLLAACRRYADATDSRITFEYVMLAGINDSRACASELAWRLRGIPAKVNLIPYNSVSGVDYRRSPQAAIDRFRERLFDAGILAITRKTRGEDIEAACGQLVGQFIPRASRHRPGATDAGRIL